MAKLLLDTHAAIFWWTDSPELGRRARDAIADGDSPVVISSASCWEIATKFRLGKMPLFDDPSVQVPDLASQHGFGMLPITADHALRAGSLTGTHRDPFDRIIAAQGMIEQMVVVTRDPEIARFGCKVLW